MAARQNLSFKGALAFVLLSGFLIFTAPAQGAGPKLYTHTQELICGDAKVDAFTTCFEEPDEHFPNCVKQHFLFSNRQTGSSVKIRASGRRYVDGTLPGRPPFLDGLAWRWACIGGKGGLYVIMDYWTGGNCGPCEWSEIFDLKGRKVLTDKSHNDPMTDREVERFNKKWDSLGLPNPWPEKAFVNIKVQKKDR